MRIRISENAEADIDDAINWTHDHFGSHQAAIYQERIMAAIYELADHPETPLAWTTEYLHSSARLVPVARAGQAASHLILFRYVEQDVIEIGGLIHVRHDLPQHLPKGYGA